VFGAFVEGWRRAWRAPALAIGVLAALFLVSVPLALTPGELLGGDPRSSLRSALLASAAAWTAEQPGPDPSAGSAGLDTLLGFGRTLAAPYLLFWVFLSGGMLDRLARGRPVGTAHFFGVSGVFLLRFVRLGLPVALAYYLLFRLLRPQISSRAEFVVFLAGLALVNLVADFAKVRAVVEDRRSMLGALLAAVRFIRTRPLRTVGLFALHVLAGTGIILLWARMTPGSVASPWIGLALAALFLLMLIVAKLAFMASEVALFQRELAHASYTAMPAPVWPDSPSIEAIENFTAHARQAPRLEGHGAQEEREGSTW
jgi:hypothetical protein